MCGCRREQRVDELARAIRVKLTESEIKESDRGTEKYKMRNLGRAVFRFAVRKK